ncbi:hypothetical protein HOY82DRAFT_558727, partial [Tuber indicum]
LVSRLSRDMLSGLHIFVRPCLAQTFFAEGGRGSLGALLRCGLHECLSVIFAIDFWTIAPGRGERPPKPCVDRGGVRGQQSKDRVSV